MRLGRLFSGIVLILSTAAAQGAPLEAYGQLPTLDNLAISPDGKNLAFSTDVDGKRTVLIHSFADNKIIAGLKTGTQKLRDLSWADNDHLLITQSTTAAAIGVIAPRSEYYLTQSFSLTTKQQTGFPSGVEDSMNVVLRAPQCRTVDGHRIVFLVGVTFVNNNGVPALFSFNLESNHTKLVERGTKYTDNWLLDQNGRILGTTEYDDKERRWSLHIRHGSDSTEVFTTTAPIESPYVLGVGPDGTSLIFMVPQNGEIVQKRLNLADDSWLAPLDLGRNPAGVVRDPVSDRIIGTVRLGVATSYVFFDQADQAAWNGVVQAFPGENVQLVSSSDDRRTVVVRVDGAKDGAIYHLVDMNAHRASPIGPVYQGIAAGDVAAVKLIRYQAADGRWIPAYLTLPNNRAPKGLPLIVLPHGGPAARDMPEFDWWSQALASRGYAVLQPQFRGSDGFGWEHLAAGFGEWGRKMQTDLSDGVRFLAADGTIDAKRVCIAGASYGGYAALAGPTLDPGIYRCAVSVSGVSDPHDMLEWQLDRAHTSDNRALRFWTRFMGAQNIDDPKLQEISPLAHAASVGIPILLIHGKDDTVVPIDQSEEMERALRRAGKTVTFITLDGEDHWLSKSVTRLQMLQATVAFLEANNPPN